MLKNRTRFNNSILKYAAEQKILRPIAFYYCIKAKYDNSCLYNYNPIKRGKEFGLHPKTVERYVKKLMAHKFVILRDGNLIAVANKKCAPEKQGYKSVETRPYTSFEGILNRIYTTILINNKYQQTFEIAKHYEDKLGALNPRLRKKVIKKIDFSKGYGLENSQTAIISVTGASRLFNVSRATAQTILTVLKKKNYLTFRSIVNNIGKARPLKYLDGYLGHFYNSGRYCYQYIGREIKEGRYYC